ncbi:MAG: hypothetical protein HC876_08955 [Chloroflexaceae bacterium]|nr:hypothetical protein [Chloroflexaceae bacterium]
MNQIALRRLIGGSMLVWVVCAVILMTHSVPPQQWVDAHYVTVNWDIAVKSPIPGDTNDVSVAFRIGYNADAGSPISDISLGFGSQVDPDDVERECLPMSV